ncbi:MAG TPA: PAS domain S-box protein, partial [Dehalococcoidia bacterium]|nr:PAS domain S-box protein [Dehalococcoidia bacterium]
MQLHQQDTQKSRGTAKPHPRGGKEHCEAEPLAWEILTVDGAFAVDSQQRIVLWSESAQEILGYSAEEVLGQPCYKVMSGHDYQNLRFCRRRCPTITNAQRGRPTPNYDLLVAAKDRRRLWLNMSILLQRQGARQRPLVLHLFRNVSQRRQ